MYQNNPAGVSTGLAYTSMGGSVLYIETIFEDWQKEEDKFTTNTSNTQNNTNENEKDEEKDKKKPAYIQGLKLTGNLGKTISESSEIAYSYAKT